MYKLKIKSKPISTNSAYYKRNRSFNQKSRIWRHNFFKSLQNDANQKIINEIKSQFDPQKHVLSVVFRWLQPKEFLFTQAGELSLRSMDVDNCLKIPIDCLFDKKYNDTWLSKRSREEAKLYNDMHSLSNLQINDKFIFDVRSIKSLSCDNEYHCEVEINIHPIKKLGNQ